MPQVLVYVTAGSREKALAIGRAVVDERLAACVNILGSMTSIYRWQGEICEDEEVAFIVKTRDDLVAALSERIRALHDYDVPCVVALPIAAGNPDFLNWIAAQCRSGGSDGGGED